MLTRISVHRAQGWQQLGDGPSSGIFVSGQGRLSAVVRGENSIRKGPVGLAK